MENYFIELPKISFNKKKLLDIKNKNLDKVRVWEHNGEPEGYSEIYWSYDEGKHLFYDMFPFECKGYQYVILPKNYRIGIHRDVKIGGRLGVLLEGVGGINFYSERQDEAYECTANYCYPTLLDPLAFHDVLNNFQERATFFLVFSEDYKTLTKKFCNYR